MTTTEHEGEPGTPMSGSDLAMKVAKFKVMKDFAEAQYNAARAELAAHMQRGDRLNAVTADGVKIGAVSKSDPKSKTYFTDQAKFRKWVATHYPEQMVSALDVIGTDEEVHDVLLEHAKHLLQEVPKVEPAFVREISRLSAKRGEPVGPGGELDIPGVQVDTPEGVLSCTPTDEAMAVVASMLQTGEIDLFDAIPGGAE